MPPRKRRQYGTGSITRRPDGTWLGRIELTPSRQGQARRRKSFVSNNIVITCWDCNAAKGTMTEPEFRAWAAKGKFFTRERKPQIFLLGRVWRFPNKAAARHFRAAAGLPQPKRSAA
ncbi:MAG TPA: hypothetical protein VIO38_07210 [Rariglobus sp.]